jgi:hypothetical protein
MWSDGVVSELSGHPGAVENPHPGSADPDDPASCGGSPNRLRPRRGAPAWSAASVGKRKRSRSNHEEHTDGCRHGVGSRRRDARPRPTRRLASRRYRPRRRIRRQRGRAGVHWVVDPIDGTVNFPYGLPWYAVSVAAVRDGGRSRAPWSSPRPAACGPQASVGATCDGEPLSVSGATDVALSLLHGLLLPCGAEGSAGRDDRRVLPHVRDVRRTGSAALDLCGWPQAGSTRTWSTAAAGGTGRRPRWWPPRRARWCAHPGRRATCRRRTVWGPMRCTPHARDRRRAARARGRAGAGEV